MNATPAKPIAPIPAAQSSRASLPLRTLLPIALALVCLASSWYFACVIAPAGLGGSAPTARQGLFPEWFGCREILDGRDPYRPEATAEIQKVIHGDDGTRLPSTNQHRFAYPVFFAVLFLPLALLSFRWAQLLTLLSSPLFTACGVSCWSAQPGSDRLQWLSYTILALGSYPVVLAVQLRQPSLIIAGLLAIVIYWVRRGSLVRAGILAALCTSKPQLAVAVLLPLGIWCLSRWRERKTLLLSLGASFGVMLLASEIVAPGWPARWLDTLRAYAHYAGSAPLLAELLHGHGFPLVSCILIAGVIWTSWQFCNVDLLCTLSLSISAFQLLFPFQIYNEVLLLPVAVWMMTNARRICARGQMQELFYDSSCFLLGAGWVAAFGLSCWNLITPGAGVRLWQLPLAAAWLYPWTVFGTLACYTASCLWHRERAAAPAAEAL